MLDNNWDGETLKQSYKACDRIMAERAKSFYQSFRLLPVDRFKAVTALYAYNRYVDDLVDNDVRVRDIEEILKGLDELEALLEAQFSTSVSVAEDLLRKDFYRLEWWPAFEDTVRRYEIPVEALIDQIRGQRMDMENFRIDTAEDLVVYSQHVAGSVGIMMLPLLLKNREDFSRPDLQKACLDLGVGMQITNILRDVGEDYRKYKRIYLPTRLRDAYGIDEALIANLAWSDASDNEVAEKIPSSFVELWESLSRLADQHYESITSYIHYFHPTARFPILAAGNVYHGIADAVREASYNCFTKRNYTSHLKRIELIARAKRHESLKLSDDLL